MSTRPNRFSASFTPSLTMRNLRSAFASPTRSSRSTSTTSYSSTMSTSPLTQHPSTTNYNNYNPTGSHTRNPSPQSSRSAHSLAEILAVRRRPSTLEFEMQMEMQVFGGDGKMDVLEPRPLDGGVVGVVGIFEVLDGKF